LSIFVSHNLLDTDLHRGEEQGTGAIFLDLPLGPATEDGSEVRYFDALAVGSDVVPIVPRFSQPIGPSQDLHEGLGGWGPRVRRRRAPQVDFESSRWRNDGRSSHSKGRWLVALLILAALPLGAALGYSLRLTPPVVVLSPEFLDFGVVAVGEIVELRATLENRGEQDLEVADIALVEEGTVDFTLHSEGCRRAVLKPGVSCLVRLAFRPSEEGVRRAEVVLRSNAVDGIRVLPVLGRGR
jgi:hypothetical protein